MTDITQTTQGLDKFKMLTETEHVLLRPGRYLGSINTVLVEKEVFVPSTTSRLGLAVELRKVNVNPAFNKLFDEVISNSSDHAKRPEGKHLNKIDVYVNRMLGIISICDNGGIPVAKHPETKLWVPDMIFGYLRSGSNFDDDPESTTTGQNGEGSSLVNIFSESFRVETADRKKSFDITYENNMASKTEPVIAPCTTGYTRITFKPDFARLGMSGLDDDAVLNVFTRCVEIAATNPNIEVRFNNELIQVRTFKDYISLFSNDNVCQLSDRWNVGLIHADEFSHVSFVNGTSTFEGGTHIDYVMDKVVEAVREYVEKKTKQKLRPSEIKSQFRLFLDATITNPRYSSQTKENLITMASAFGSKFELDDKTLKAIVTGPIMKSILEWADRRRVVEEMREAQKDLEKARKGTWHHIPKYNPSTLTDRTKAILFLAEGDSALKPLKAAKKPEHGLFPLRGKPDNVFGLSIKSLTNQAEFQHVLNIMGLDLSGKVDVSKLRYGSLVVATDADLDGIHIRGLLVVAFNRFWPELIEKGVLKFLITPIILATQGKVKHEFFNIEDFEAWEKVQTKAFTYKYYKGLGTWDTESMNRFMTDPKYMITVNKLDDVDNEKLNLAFDPTRADDRKIWLNLHE